MLHYVYTLAYPESMGGTAFYVGKGQGDRIDDHEREAKGIIRGNNLHKLNTIRKIWANGEQVSKNILAYFETHEEACVYEVALIFFLPNLTNLTDGGDGSVGFVHSVEARRKIREGNKGKKRSEETCRRISEGMKGHTITEKNRLKLIKASVGRKRSEEELRRQSKARKGKKKTEEHKRKIGEGQKEAHRRRAAIKQNSEY